MPVSPHATVPRLSNMAAIAVLAERELFMYRTVKHFSRLAPMGAIAALALAGSCSKADKANEGAAKELNDLKDRVTKLEELQKKVASHDEFLAPIMAQQKAQNAQRAASEPDPTARFAVDTTGNFMDGPKTAAVTVVEAWDFA